MLPIGKLVKLASGTLGPDEIKELAAGIGIDLSFEAVPEDRKADAFQRVAQFAVNPEAEAVLLTATTPLGGRFEGLLIIRPGRLNGMKKDVDEKGGIPLSLCASAQS